MWYLRHAEHHAKNRTSLVGLDQETLFFDLPLIINRFNSFPSFLHVANYVPNELCTFERMCIEENDRIEWEVFFLYLMNERYFKWADPTLYVLAFLMLVLYLCH